MTGLYVALGLIALVGFMMWRAKRAGVAEARGKAAEETLEQFVEGSKPVSNPERERLRTRYERP